MGEVHSSCLGGNGPEGMKAVGVVVAEGTAAGGFSVNGFTDGLEAAEPDEAMPVVLALVAVALSVLAALESEEEAEGTSRVATTAMLGSSANSVLKACKRILARRNAIGPVATMDLEGNNVGEYKENVYRKRQEHSFGLFIVHLS